MVAGTACASPAADDGSAGAKPSGPVTEAADDRLAQLERLPPCTEAPPAAAEPEVAGLVVPEGTVVTGVDQGEPLTSVEAYTPLDPVEVRRFYETTLGLKPLVIEDEVLEAEALMQSRTHRFFVKAQAACRDASRLFVVIAEQGDDAGGLPTPTGGGS